MIRYAETGDIPALTRLLLQVAEVHHRARPDIFKSGKKYSEQDLAALLSDASRPILVFTDEADTVRGYAFCVLECYKDDILRADCKTLYIDDLCVDETVRGQGIGRALYAAVLQLARELECYNVTLNVWSANESAVRFYESLGLRAQKIGMEVIL